MNDQTYLAQTRLAHMPKRSESPRAMALRVQARKIVKALCLRGNRSFVIAEAGGEDGLFCRLVLDEAYYHKLYIREYVIVTSPSHAVELQRHFESPKVRFYARGRTPFTDKPDLVIQMSDKVDPLDLELLLETYPRNGVLKTYKGPLLPKTARTTGIYSHWWS